MTGEGVRQFRALSRAETLMIRPSKPDGGLSARLADGVRLRCPGRHAVARGMNNISCRGSVSVPPRTPLDRSLALEAETEPPGEPLQAGRPDRGREKSRGNSGARPSSRSKPGTPMMCSGEPRPRGCDWSRPTMALGATLRGVGHEQNFVSEALESDPAYEHEQATLLDVHLRRAVRFAIDRTALAAQGRRAAEARPFNAAAPTDDDLPLSAAGARTPRRIP